MTNQSQCSHSLVVEPVSWELLSVTFLFCAHHAQMENTPRQLNRYTVKCINARLGQCIYVHIIVCPHVETPPFDLTNSQSSSLAWYLSEVHALWARQVQIQWNLLISVSRCDWCVKSAIISKVSKVNLAVGAVRSSWPSYSKSIPSNKYPWDSVNCKNTSHHSFSCENVGRMGSVPSANDC